MPGSGANAEHIQAMRIKTTIQTGIKVAVAALTTAAAALTLAACSQTATVPHAAATTPAPAHTATVGENAVVTLSNIAATELGIHSRKLPYVAPSKGQKPGEKPAVSGVATATDFCATVTDAEGRKWFVNAKTVVAVAANPGGACTGH
jgi:hypothetical protein